MTTFTPPVKEIHLQNIQSLPKATIEPAAPGELTVVVGESDAGKTTIASRALQKLFFNNIPNKELIRRGCTKASITVVYDTPDKLAVIWEWKGRKPDAGKARYIIRRQGMEDIVLEGGGKKVPDAVKEITGVQPVKIGSTHLNLNFNKQLDGPFLGNVSPAERYRILGALAGTLEVDAAAREVSLELYRARRRENELKTETERLDEEIKQYDYLEELGQSIASIENRLSSLQSKREIRYMIQRYGADIDEQNYYANKAREKNEYLYKKCNDVYNKITEMESKIDLYYKLYEARKQFTIQNSNLNKAERILKLTENAGENLSRIQGIEDKKMRIDSLNKLYQDIKNEKLKLSRAYKTINLTRDAENALQFLEKVYSNNHLHQFIVKRYAEISKEVESIERNNLILNNTREINEARNKLSRLESNVFKLKQIKHLAVRIQKGKKYIAGLDESIKKIQKTSKAQEELERTRGSLQRYNKLLELSEMLINRRREKSKIDAKLNHLDETVTREHNAYKELLQEAGICKDCPVVDEVIAAS